MVFQLNPTLAGDSVILAKLPLCLLLLVNDQQFPWFILVPQRVNIKEIYQLSAQDQQQLLLESSRLSAVIMQIFNGDKLNTAAIGNLVPQLHLHHVVRYKDDACWPSPIWGKLPRIDYSNDEVARIKKNVIKSLAQSGLISAVEGD